MKVPPPSYFQLLLFKAIYEEKNLGLAAARLEIPASTASRHLSELRDFFGDRLFTRFIDGLVPTRRATELLGDVERLLDCYAGLGGNSVPELKEARREVHIGCADNAIFSFCRHLYEVTMKTAPGISYTFHPLSPDRLNLLRTGRLDFVISPLMSAPEGVHSIVLGINRYELVAGLQHPLARLVEKKGPAGDEDVVRYAFIDVLMHAGRSGGGADTLRESVFPAWKDAESAVRAEYLLPFLPSLASTDLLTIIPRKTALDLERAGSLKIIPTETRSEQHEARLYWHDRSHSDVVMQWVRSKILESAKM